MAALLLIWGCQEDEPRLETILVPANLQANIQVASDQSGQVTVSPTADNAINFHVIFTPGSDPIVVSPGQSANFRFTQSGQYTAPVTVIAFGQGGVSSSKIFEVNLDVRLFIDAETLQLIAGTGTKRWVWDQGNSGHFGVGPLTNDFPEFFSASPNQLNPCLYDDVLVFSHDGNDNYTFSLEPGTDNEVFINWTEVNRFFPDATPGQFVDECRDITDQVAFESNFVIIDETDGSQTLDVTNSFLSYWSVISGQYQITELTADRLTVRGISEPFNGDPPLAWYYTFVPEDGGSTGGGDALESIFTNLVWSDEFDTNGAPNPANWTYDLGTGDNGWGNGEAQSYTSDPENVIVEDGVLKITARATSGGDQLYYFDQFELADASGTAQSVIQDFEGTPPTFTDFGNAGTQVIANPDASGENTSASVAQFSRPATAESFAGTFFEVGSPLDLSVNNRIRVKTWSPKVGAVVKLKLENSANTDENFEVDLNTTVADSWETLIYDFSSAPAFPYDRIVIFFDFGTTGSGASYSSARIKSQDLQEFTYGRIEASAKLPAAQGTWPAIWMLGANFPDVGWPTSGEIDIMEQGGQSKSTVSGTLHYPAVSPGTGNTASTAVANTSTEFHLYTVEWRSDLILFAVDGMVYHQVQNDGSLPFNADFFLIMNVAMGGTLGGSIDPAFTADTMEVDYIRVYQ